MAIYHEIVSQTPKPWGIEVVTRFWNDEKKEKFKTFVFKNMDDVTAQHDNRAEAAKIKYIEKSERILSDEEVLVKVKDYFETAVTLPRALFELWLTEKVKSDEGLEDV